MFMKKLIEFIKTIFDDKKKFILILTIISSIPIFITWDIPISHDILFHLSRVKGLSYEIGIKSFPILIYHSFIFNMGYAPNLFYPDLFLYPFAILNKFIPINIVYKLLILSLNYASIYSVYFVLSKLFNNRERIWGTILYTFSSYRLTDLYIRGNVGESLGFIFFPLVILGLEELINGDKRKYYYLVIGMTGLIYSHIISTYIVGIFIFFYILLNIKKLFKEKRYLYLMKAVLITFLLTCAFLVPMVEQMVDRHGYIHYLRTSSYDNIASPLLYLFPEVSLPSNTWYPVGIGLIYLAFIILAIKERKKVSYQTWIYGLLGVLFLIMSTNLVPRFIYNKVLIFIQYQWRFYMIATLSLLIFGMKLLPILSDKTKLILKNYTFYSIIVVLTLVFVNTFMYGSVHDFNGEYLGYYEYLPENITYDQIKNGPVSAASSNKIDYNINYSRGITTISYKNNSYDDTVLTLPILYYKGYVSNKNYDIINNNGLVAIKLNKDSDLVKVYYEGTDLLYISRVISLTTLIVIVTRYVRKRSRDVKV